MSNKPLKTNKINSFSKIFKWGFLVIFVLIFEIIAVFSSYLFIESKNKVKNDTISALVNRTQAQEKQLKELYLISEGIAENKAMILENKGNIKLAEVKFIDLKNEVGNNKVELLDKRLSDVQHRMESVEETKNTESLILSLALIIKENSLYNRPINNEIELLKELSQNQSEIVPYISTLVSLKSFPIKNDYQIIEQYNSFVRDFYFVKNTPESESNDNSKQKSTMAKSIELIKDTMAGINFDKVVQIKKDPKTEAEKVLLQKLSEYIDNYRFGEAITFIKNTPKFAEADHDKFKNWFGELERKHQFDSALSNIIAFELNSIREDFNKEISAQSND